MNMWHRFSGMITFIHPETNEIFYINYRGSHRPAKITADPQNSYPAEWDIAFTDFPPELKDYEECLRQDVINSESEVL